ncbi:MAG: EfeM/EfeO family lipoprotein, partial [Solirubrobacterales bacterium]
ESQAKNLDADAQQFEPTPSDAFTAITVMTPTMSEYFEAWKSSRFIAGGNASELGFVAASRLSDIADILEGLVLTYDQIEPQIADENPQQAEQTGKELAGLLAFVEDLRDREVDGRKYTAEDADTLGAEAQRRAEAIAGQVTQAAQQLQIELQEA